MLTSTTVWTQQIHNDRAFHIAINPGLFYSEPWWWSVSSLVWDWKKRLLLGAIPCLRHYTHFAVPNFPSLKQWCYTTDIHSRQSQNCVPCMNVFQKNIKCDGKHVNWIKQKNNNYLVLVNSGYSFIPPVQFKKREQISTMWPQFYKMKEQINKLWLPILIQLNWGNILIKWNE